MKMLLDPLPFQLPLLLGIVISLPGCPDETPVVRLDPADLFSAPGAAVNAIAVQADGKILIGGTVGDLEGGRRDALARYSINGSSGERTREDAQTFNPNIDGPLDRVDAIAVLANGGILIGGHFPSLAGASHYGLARLHPDGSLDTDFQPDLTPAAEADIIVVQPDGKLVIGFKDGGHPRVTRLEAQGGVDAGFYVTVDGDGAVHCIALREDGKLFLGGRFTTVNGQPRSNLVRLLESGGVDMGFDAGSIEPIDEFATPEVNCIVPEPDGNTLIGGFFARVNGTERLGIAMLDETGGVLPFEPDQVMYGNFRLRSMLRQADGTHFVIGDFLRHFASIDERQEFLVGWLRNFGEMDATGRLTKVEHGRTSWQSLASLNDGTTVVGTRLFEGFTHFGSRTGGDRLEISGTTVARWHREGRAPDVTQVTFELSTDLATWSPLGSGARFAGGWEVSGLSLPEAGWIRARGRCFSGRGGGSSGLVEKILRFPADAIAPDTAIVSGPLGAVASPTAAFTFTSNEPALSYRYHLDYGPPYGSPVQINAPSLTLENLAPGPHTLSVAAVDLAGNVDPTPATRTWIVDAGATADGQPDFTFAGTGVPVTDGEVHEIALQPEGGIVIAGGFDLVHGDFRPRLARLDADGELVPLADFNAGAGPTLFGGTPIHCLTVQPDACILVAGEFREWNFEPTGSIVRLRPNGEVDPFFEAGNGVDSGVMGSIFCQLLQPDGKILVGGSISFDPFGAQPRENLVRLRDDGTLDPGFVANLNGDVTAMTLLPGGRILVTGVFNEVNGQSADNLVRLMPNGTLDPQFAPAHIPGIGYAIAVQADGSILVAGEGSMFEGFLLRFLPDGTPEGPATFHPGPITGVVEGGQGGGIYDLALQSDGRILIVGAFTEVAGQPRGGVARLHPDDGSLDGASAFNPSAGALASGDPAGVYAVALQADGGILLGGDFTEVAGQAAGGIARLRNGAAMSRIVTRGNFAAEWLTGGTAPHPGQVRFELNTGGGWQNLGSASRTAGGWGLTGLTLPVNGQLRALGYPHTNSGHASLIARELTLDAPLRLWSDNVFQENADDPSIAGDFADPDGDGVLNIAEYAAGTNPLDPRGRPQPSGGVSAAGLTFTYQRGADATDIVFDLEQSLDLLNWGPATYTEEILTDDGVIQTVRATVPVNLAVPIEPGAYLRARITHRP